MKIAFAGKGGVGKTTLCAWLGDYLARQGQDVILVDADTALSLGQACGLSADSLPVPLIERECESACNNDPPFAVIGIEN